jgi:Cytochrome c554 and c-prime
MEQMKARFQFASCSNSSDWPVCGDLIIRLYPRVSGEWVKPQLPTGQHSWFINPATCGLARQAFPLLLAVVSFCLTGSSGFAQGVPHLTVIQPGGMPGLPVMTGIQKNTNGVTMTWDGPSGYYHLYQKSQLPNGTWQPFGNFNLNRTTTLSNLSSNAFFRVSGPGPRYAGEQTCAQCHGSVHSTVMTTAHAQAFQTLKQIHQDTNSGCLPCHTVGYGLPTGFTSAVLTPQLEGVQCENCHGPGGNHAANSGDQTVIPRVELAAQVCGGCHNLQDVPQSVAAYHPSFFEDWDASPHQAVVPDVLQSMASSANNINSCGRCHSGSAREALLEGQNPVTLTNDYNVAITCAVCHEPHGENVWTNVLNGVIAFSNQLTGITAYITNSELGLLYTNQMRNAFASTNDFYLTTSDVFSNKYNPAINVCAQCHNDRGAAWADTSRSPHHSPQYNILLGTVGELTTGPTPGLPATHSRLEMQCAGCHMQTTNTSSGHTFELVTYQLCYNCHSDPAGLVRFTANNISNQIQQTKSLLDLWATNKAPPALQTKYGVLAWEYSTPGDLSTGSPGPSSAEQGSVTNDIKKARFDLYLVLYDGSYGVHNAQYDLVLLQNAQTFVDGQLFQ